MSIGVQAALSNRMAAFPTPTPSLPAALRPTAQGIPQASMPELFDFATVLKIIPTHFKLSDFALGLDCEPSMPAHSVFDRMIPSTGGAELEKTRRKALQGEGHELMDRESNET